MPDKESSHLESLKLFEDSLYNARDFLAFVGETSRGDRSERPSWPHLHESWARAGNPSSLGSPAQGLGGASPQVWGIIGFYVLELLGHWKCQCRPDGGCPAAAAPNGPDIRSDEDVRLRDFEPMTRWNALSPRWIPQVPDYSRLVSPSVSRRRGPLVVLPITRWWTESNAGCPVDTRNQGNFGCGRPAAHAFAWPVLDGPVDRTHPCFAGADLNYLDSYWQDVERAESDYVTHATHVSSVIFGQHDSPVQGIAPRCRGLSIAVAVDKDSVVCPLSLTRGINQALDAGANIIHIAPCLPTKSGIADDLVERAVRAAIDNNILVIAPAGNDRGECWCIPAALPGVLAVGALNEEGKPFQFSNWGGIYQSQGILVPGENILGACRVEEPRDGKAQAVQRRLSPAWPPCS